MSDLVGTVAQVAERLEVDEQFVRELIRNNEIPHIKLGPRKTIIPWRTLEDWLDARARLSLSDPPPLGLVADAGT